MALSKSDLGRAAASVAAVSGTDAFHTGRCRVMGVTLAAGTDAAEVEIYDATATSGTATIIVKALANDSKTVWFGPAGVRFATGLHGDLTVGTSPTAYLYYLSDVVNT